MAERQSLKLHSPQPQRQALLPPTSRTNLFQVFQRMEEEDQVTQEVAKIISQKSAGGRGRLSGSPAFKRNCAMPPERDGINPLVFDEAFVAAAQTEELLPWDFSISTP